jgi:hypothetical protein
MSGFGFGLGLRRRPRGVDGGGAAPSLTAPSDLSNLRFWYKADGTLFQDSARTTPAVPGTDPVGDWDDASGGGFHVAQVTAGQRPVLTANVQNGKPGVRFTRASSQFLTRATGAFAIQTLFVCLKKPTAANFPAGVFPGVISGADLASASQWCFGYQSSANIGTNSGLGANVYADGVLGSGPHFASFAPLDSPHVYEVTCASFTGTGLDLGYNGDFYDGYILETFGFTDLKSAGDRALMRTYLRDASRWNF